MTRVLELSPVITPVLVFEQYILWTLTSDAAAPVAKVYINPHAFDEPRLSGDAYVPIFLNLIPVQPAAAILKIAVYGCALVRPPKDKPSSLIFTQLDDNAQADNGLAVAVAISPS